MLYVFISLAATVVFLALLIKSENRKWAIGAIASAAVLIASMSFSIRSLCSRVDEATSASEEFEIDEAWYSEGEFTFLTEDRTRIVVVKAENLSYIDGEAHSVVHHYNRDFWFDFWLNPFKANEGWWEAR